MGIFGALTTAVGGLRANSYALENVSGNIANSQTTAFKRVDTSFLDLIPQTSATAQLAGRRPRNRAPPTRGRATCRRPRSRPSWRSTATVLRGAKAGNFTDGTPVFDGVDRYTRRGDFQIDKSGYLVNGAGYYLQGVPIDPTTGNPSGSSPQVLRFQNDFLPAQETTRIDYRANLASYPLTTKNDVSVPGSELIAPGSYTVGRNPLALGTPAAPYTGRRPKAAPRRATKRRRRCQLALDPLSGAAGSNSISADFVVGTPSRSTPNHHLRGVRRRRQQPGQRRRQHRNLAGQDRRAPGNGTRPDRGGSITLHSGTAAICRSQVTTAPPGRTRLHRHRDRNARRGVASVPARSSARHLDSSERVGGGWCGHNLRRVGCAGEPAVPLGQDRQHHARPWPQRYLEPVLSDQPNATGTQVAWQNVNTNFTFSASGQMSPAVPNITLANAVVNGVALGSPVINFGTGGVTQFATPTATSGQPDPAGRFPGRPVAVRRRRHQRPHRPATIPTAATWTRRNSVATFNGTNFSSASTAARSSNRRIRPGAVGKAGTIVGSSLEDPTPTSPTSSPS